MITGKLCHVQGRNVFQERRADITGQEVEGSGRGLGICQVWKSNTAVAQNEEQGCLGFDRKTSVLGDKDRGPYQ